MNIMIVDDEPINIRVARKYLQQHGYRNFVTCSDAAEALSRMGLGHLDPRAPLASISIALQQLVAISRAMVVDYGMGTGIGSRRMPAEDSSIAAARCWLLPKPDEAHQQAPRGQLPLFGEAG